MPSCSSTSSSSSPSRRYRTRCWPTSRRWRRACRAAVSRGVVGVGLYLLDHQLAGSRKDAGPAVAVCADARRPRAVDLDPDGVRRSRTWFAIAYAAMQVGKTVFLWIVTPSSRPPARLNAVRITTWLSVSAIFWIAGGLMQGQSRLALWAVALGGRISLAGGAVLDPPLRRVVDRGLGRRGRAYRRTLRAASSSSRSANPSSSPAPPLPT